MDQIRAAKLIHYTFPSKESKSYQVFLKVIYSTDFNKEVLKEELAKKIHIVKK